MKNNSQRKTLGKTSRITIEMKIKNQFPKILFFFDFFNPLKQIKINLLNPKTLSKLVVKTLKKMRIFALEIVD